MLTAQHTAIIDQDPARVGIWMGDHGGGHWREGGTCIGLEREGQLVAGVMYDYYNGASIFAHIAIAGPITREWLRRICHYPSIQLGCQVVIGLVASDNQAAQQFDAHFGFKKRLDIAGADPAGSLLIYTLDKADCRFLGRSHHGETESTTRPGL